MRLHQLLSTITLVAFIFTNCDSGTTKSKRANINEYFPSIFFERAGLGPLDTSGYHLLQDSIEIKSLGITLFVVVTGKSHGTYYRIVRDDRNGEFFIVPIGRGHYISAIPYDLIRKALWSNINQWIEVPSSVVNSLEAFLNQPSRQGDLEITYNQLDSIISYGTFRSYKRIRTNAQLDSAIQQLSIRSTMEPGLVAFVRDELSVRLAKRSCLLYLKPNICLDMFEINPLSSFYTQSYLEPELTYEEWKSQRYKYGSNIRLRFIRFDFSIANHEELN